MTRIFLILCFLFYYFGSKDKISKVPISSFIIADTVQTVVYPIFDSLNLLDKYSALINTPVCEVDKCYAIEVVFYWDQIGRFLHYDTIVGQGLTKLDHVPFTTVDYIKLDDILGNQNSILASYTKENLVKNTRDSELDGFTGATVQEIKQSVINGAVYSCYSLWHIANGSVVDSLKKVTTSLFSKELVKKMMISNDPEVNYFMINNFSVENYVTFLPEVLMMIKNGEGYFAKNAIELMPEKTLNSEKALDFFAIHFEQLNYYSQVAFLTKVNKNSIGSELKQTLQENVDDRNSYKNELIQELIEDN